MKIFTKMFAGLAASMLLVGVAAAEQVTVETNFTKPVRIKGAASSVVIGNPNIADVSVHSNNLLFVTGKMFGTTNLMVFDADGRQIYGADVVVTTETSSLVTVNRSGSSFTYDCSPDCRSVMSMGDNAAHFDNLKSQQEGIQKLSENN